MSVTSGPLPYDLSLRFDDPLREATISGLVTVTAREDAHCRKLILRRLARSQDGADLLADRSNLLLLTGLAIWILVKNG